MEKNVWLYFNQETDDDTVTASSNGMFPASALKSLVPGDHDSKFKVHFESMKNISCAKHDTVLMSLTAANTHLDVFKTIVRATNNTRPTFNGFVNVCDDLTTIVGGAAGSSTAVKITDNSQETGKIDACLTITLGDPTNGAIVATADGTGTGTVPGGGFYSTSSTDANHIVVLPAATLGTVVYLNSDAETGQAYELRTSDPANIALNNVTGAGKESAIATGMSLVVATCVLGGASGRWSVTEQATVGATDVHTVPVAD